VIKQNLVVNSPKKICTLIGLLKKNDALEPTDSWLPELIPVSVAQSG